VTGWTDRLLVALGIFAAVMAAAMVTAIAVHSL
jgi:hypothetical protein